DCEYGEERNPGRDRASPSTHPLILRPFRGPDAPLHGSRVLTSRVVTMPKTETPNLPLTSLAEDEVLFRDSVSEFADREIRPLVREMDEHAKIPRQLKIGRASCRERV